MTTTNDKPTNTPTDNETKTPAGAPANKPASYRSDENKVKDPTTVGDAIKKPLDPNNPQAKHEAPGVDDNKATEKV